MTEIERLKTALIVREKQNKERGETSMTSTESLAEVIARVRKDAAHGLKQLTFPVEKLLALCTAAEQNATTIVESVRVATEELRAERDDHANAVQQWIEIDRQRQLVVEDLRGELDRTQGTCDQLMHELNAICAERDRLRRALELANGLDPYAPDLHKMLEVFDAQRKALSAPRTEEGS